MEEKVDLAKFFNKQKIVIKYFIQLNQNLMLQKLIQLDLILKKLNLNILFIVPLYLDQ